MLIRILSSPAATDFYLKINEPHPTSIGLSKANGTELYFIFLPCSYGTWYYHEKVLISYCDLYQNFTRELQNSRKHLKEFLGSMLTMRIPIHLHKIAGQSKLLGIT